MSKAIVIAVDFDGTLVEHRFPEIGPDLPGAFDWLNRFQAAGAKLILWTMRSDGRSGPGRANGPVLTEAVEFCRARGVEFYGINCNPDQAAWTASPKAYAQIYIDDLAFGCPLTVRVDPTRLDGDPYAAAAYADWSVIGPEVMSQIDPNWDAAPSPSPAKEGPP